MNTIIAYYRVSTRKQGESGLGLDAQRALVQTYGSPIAEYTEIESGKVAARPELKKAIAHAKAIGATLVVAKLDRLARNVLFIATLMESGVDFVAADMPAANRFTLHVMAAVAEQEALMISERTKAALQAAKARGVKLGGARPGGGWGPQHKELKKQRFDDRYAEILPVVRALRAQGVTEQGIADELNRQGRRSPKGGMFRQSTVHNLLVKAS